MEEDITTDLTILQSCLDTMINKVEGDNLMLKQFQSFQLRLLDLTTLPEIIDFILEELKVFLALDDISLSLIDHDEQLTGYLNNYDYQLQQNQGLVLLEDKIVLVNELSSGPYIGIYDNNKHEVFFPLRKKIPPTIAIMPLNRHGEYIGSLNMASSRADCFINSFSTNYINLVVSVISIAFENSLHFEQNKQRKLIEALAEANNRNFLEQRLTEELDRNQRSINCVSCLMIDIIFSKGRKSSNTQNLEEHVLKSVSELLKQYFRLSDVFSYYEGKKFAALLMNVSDDVVIAVAERIQNALKEHKISFAGQSVPVSAAFGYASYQLTADATSNHKELAVQLINDADTHLQNTSNE